MHVDAIQCGEHAVRREARDLFVYRFGEVPAKREEVEALVGLEKSAWPELDGIFILVCLKDGVGISGGVLSATARMFVNSPPRTSAFVTKQFVLRTAMEFLGRMVRALGIRSQTRIFEDEASARAWLDSRRVPRAAA